MNKIILLGAIACSAAFYSCSKNDNNATSPVTVIPKDSINPVALSAAVKVANGTSATGTLPATTTGAPVLLTDGYDMRTYYAVSNRYVVIYPRSTTGFIAGYYVKINGADNYFKITFPEQTAPPRKANPHSNLREDGDNSDSAIIIKLPAGLKGDTFSIKYAAYDKENRVSNTLTAIVSIVASKDSTDNNLLAGTWKYNRSKYNDQDWSKPYSYKIDTSYTSYSCVDGVLNPCDGGCEDYPSYISGSTANDIIFSANNTYTEYYTRVEKYLDTESSSCSNLVYADDGGYDDKYVSGYSYDATTKILTIIYDGNGYTDGGDASNITIYQYTVTEISATKLVYMEKSYDTGDRIGARGYDGNVRVYYYEYLKK